MESFRIKDIVNACCGELISGNAENIVKGFSKDSRNICNGDLYVGIKGENFDGNSYCYDAIGKGAIGAIIEEEYKEKLDLDKIKDKNIIIVKNRGKSSTRYCYI